MLLPQVIPNIARACYTVALDTWKLLWRNSVIFTYCSWCLYPAGREVVQLGRGCSLMISGAQAELGWAWDPGIVHHWPGQAKGLASIGTLAWGLGEMRVME